MRRVAVWAAMYSAQLGSERTLRTWRRPSWEPLWRRRGDAEQGPGGAAAEGAELGHVGQQGSGGDRSDAGDRAQHVGAPAQAVVGLE